MLSVVARFPLFESPFELFESFLMFVKTSLLFEIDAE